MKDLKSLAVGLILLGFCFSLYSGTRTFKTSKGEFKNVRILILYPQGPKAIPTFTLVESSKNPYNKYDVNRIPIQWNDLASEDQSIFLPRDIGVYRNGQYTVLKMCQIDGITHNKIYMCSFDKTDPYFKTHSRRLVFEFKDVEKSILKELGLLDHPYFE